MDSEILTPSYYGIITAAVRYDRKIPDGAKLLYSELTALSNKFGYCNASNGYFAELYNVEKNTISRWVKALYDHGHISVEVIYKENSREVLERRLYGAALPPTGPAIKNDGSPAITNEGRPTIKNDEDNTTSLNTTSLSSLAGGGDHFSPELTEKIDETMVWLKNRKSMRHLPPQQYLDLFIELARYGIDLDGFRLYYEWLEGEKWVRKPIGVPLLKSAQTIESYLNRDKLGAKNGKRSDMQEYLAEIEG